MEPKCKSMCALQRFLGRGGGYFSSCGDSSLADVGLKDMVPSHFGRQGMS